MNVLLELREKARRAQRRIVLPETQDARVLQAAAILAKEKLCVPVLLDNGRMAASPPQGCEVITFARDPRAVKFAEQLYEKRKAKGLTLDEARAKCSQDPLYFGAFLVASGDCAGAVAGSEAATADVLRAGLQVIGLARGIDTLSSCFLMVFPDKVLTYADCGVVPNPTSEQLVDIALAASESHRRLVGESPRVALLSASNFGTVDDASARKMRDALELVREWAPDLEIDGEMQADAALLPQVRAAAVNDSTLTGEANVLVMPSRDAANIAMHLLTVLGEGVPVGPLLHGLKVPAHILTASATARRIVNLSAVAAVDAQALAERR